MGERVDCVIVGAGVVGLAVGRALATRGLEVIVVERSELIGSETSSRNSEVIHAGIYYPTNSLKARLCVDGKRLLYAYCASHQVPHQRCGKIIVATQEAQLETLAAYQRQALDNGAGELRLLAADEIHELEPEVRAIAGVLSESTGIIDSHALMLSLHGELEHHGGMVAFNTEVEDLVVLSDGIRVTTNALPLEARWLINCAGLQAPELSKRLTAEVPRARYALGHYYAYSGKAPFSRLVYPVAAAGGLGVHVTLDLGGQARFGPDVRWIDAVDYTFDDNHRAEFLTAIRRYFPAVDESRLHPSYTGIRPKIVGPGEPAADFRIDGPTQHGVPGFVQLLGIESPGLTASLAIAERVADIVDA